MNIREFSHILAAIILFTIVGGLFYILKSAWTALPTVFLFAVIVIFISIFAKKAMAYALDSDVEHELWTFSRYGLKPSQHFAGKIPAGIVFPLAISLFTLGSVKFLAFITYEARALKKRAAKRFGFYSYTELTEWHNALIGAAGIIAALLIATIAYFVSPNFEYLAKMATFYALSNILPIPKFDGMQIFMGSKVLYTILGIITLIFAAYAMVI